MNIYLYILHLLAAISFIVALKRLGHPRTALAGNTMGGLGMLVAIVATVLLNETFPPVFVFIALGIGGLIGLLLALKIQFTAMPQLVALFNGFGGVASTLVASVVLYYGSQLVGSGQQAADGRLFTQVAVITSGIVGSVTLTGSVIAFAKLQGLVSEKAVRYPGDGLLRILAIGAVVASVVWIVNQPDNANAYWAMSAAAGLLGIFLVVPIGGADMPVVIALLNSYSGLAATATGFGA